MRLRISPLAGQDIAAIGDYIAQDNPTRAFSFTHELLEQCKLIGENPCIYRERPELGKSRRSCTYGRYVLIYDTRDDEVLIERVLHGSRDIDGLGSWSSDELKS
ncbi:type II toxin-antitoxin system RelE/ParE family toxin [Sodalis ligni]|uniref:type II toxin-antitoxin system RelE/ParE family toxin n=1 Tax=Sodalis ligni TaxID=2697027 RepID=UPI001BDE29AE|nr:type II toxin-antitoxin system RelE/ParE family toxin [Sodalis ligni]QWA11602.1 type II toxin-antitoxin system RelE/ParE family toxin [Sodalis ligni]QWA11607.1 type II toxin-antitoxin system RelE/ParE family toxin [Sodalis ligni]QWA11611.1 type II toxin-antitoxin system RelE/ParE family toxin [Sodalis ligni]